MHGLCWDECCPAMGGVHRPSDTLTCAQESEDQDQEDSTRFQHPLGALQQFLGGLPPLAAVQSSTANDTPCKNRCSSITAHMHTIKSRDLQSSFKMLCMHVTTCMWMWVKVEILNGKVTPKTCSQPGMTQGEHPTSRLVSPPPDVRMTPKQDRILAYISWAIQ